MTVLNCYISRSRVLASVDTRTIGDAGAALHMQKMMPLAHLNAVIAFRGHNLFTIMATAQVYASVAELDELLDTAPSFLFKMHQEALAVAQRREIGNIDALRGRQEILLAGWSKKKDRMIGCVYQNDPPREGFTATVMDEDGCYYKAPGEADPGQPVGIADMPCSTIDEMITLARKQKAMIEQYLPGHIATPGGNLIVAEIARDTMTIATVCDLDENDCAASRTISGTGAR